MKVRGGGNPALRAAARGLVDANLGEPKGDGRAAAKHGLCREHGGKARSQKKHLRKDGDRD